VLGLDDDVVRQACSDAASDEVLEAVNFNSPGQVVVAGNRAAVERVVDLAKERGAKRALLLPVSVPSHCALMRPAAEQLAKVLDEVAIEVPTIPVINNADVATPSEPAAIRDALVRQLYSPVRWVETIQKMAGDGVERLVECGPGKVLVGLNKRIERKMAAQAVFDPDSLNAALAEE